MSATRLVVRPERLIYALKRLKSGSLSIKARDTPCFYGLCPLPAVIYVFIALSVLSWSYVLWLGDYQGLCATVVERGPGKAEYGVRFDRKEETVYLNSWWLEKLP